MNTGDPAARPAIRLKRVAIVAGVVAASAAALVALAAAALAGGAGGPLVRTVLEAKLHRAVRFSHLAVTSAPEGLRLVFSDLHVGQPRKFGPGDLVQAPRAELVLRPWPLLLGRLEAPEVRLTSPELHLRRLGPGDDNWTFGHGRSGASGFLGATRTLSITGGRLDMDDPQRHLALQGAFAHDPTVADLPLSLQGGGVLQGEAFRVVARGGPLNARKPGAPHAFQVEMEDGATHLRLAGTAQAPFDFRGLDADVQAQGPNLADLIYLFNLLTPNSPPFRLSGHLHREGHRFSLTHLDAKLGDSDVTGEIRSDHTARRTISATLHSHRLAAADLRVLLASPPPHAATRASAGVSGHGRTPSGKLFSQTPVSLRRLGGSDDALDYRADTATGFGAPVTSLALRLRLAQGRLAFAPLTFAMNGGAVRIDYALDTTPPQPAGRLDAHVHGLRLAGGRRGSGGLLDADVQVRGTGPSIARQAATAQGRAGFRLTAAAAPKLAAAALSGDVLGGLAAMLSPGGKTPLRCAVADFTLAGGVARATRLVVVTASGAATGGGEVDLRDERLALQLHASASGPHPLVQLRAPIVISGTLTKPHASAKPPPPVEGIRSVLGALGRLVGGKPPPGPPAPAC